MTPTNTDGQYVLDHMKGDEFADFECVNSDFRLIRSSETLIPKKSKAC
jgi:hypothetical protein